MQVGRVDVGKLMQEVVQRRNFHAQSRRIKVSVDIDNVHVAMLDGEKMSVILDNLLSNAIDFSPDDGEIRLIVRQQDGLLRFECIDQGPGIAPEDVQRIFDPFVQGRRQAPAERQGSGVGLSIVRELLRAMGGRVGIIPGDRGAHFCVEIPNEK